jgi:hypothetical protein
MTGFDEAIRPSRNPVISNRILQAAKKGDDIDRQVG